MSIENIFFQLGFKISHEVEGRLTIADLFINSKTRCGVYLLELGDNTIYIGSSNNIVRRFREHKIVHNSVIRLHFQRTSVAERKIVESDVIKRAENLGLPLINVIGTVNIVGDTDLDELISPADQNQWLSNSSIDFSDTRPDDAIQRLRFKYKFNHFQQYPNFDFIISLLRVYVQSCIPSFRQTEKSFWNISCLSSTNKNSWPRLICISMNAMETLVIGHHLTSQETNWAFINISKTVFRQEYPTNQSFCNQHPNAELRNINYSAAGADQIAINVHSLLDLQKLLDDSAIIQASRILNLRLMRKGSSRYSQYHCFHLADLIIE